MSYIDRDELVRGEHTLMERTSVVTDEIEEKSRRQGRRCCSKDRGGEGEDFVGSHARTVAFVVAV